MAGVTINEGTQTNIKTTTVGTQEYQHVVLNIGTSSDNPYKGTIAEITNIASGSIARLGTLQAGTINVGTVSDIGLLHPDRWGTVVTSGTSDLGTIKPLVSGSVIYITDITVAVGSASNVVVASGGTSTPIWGTLFFNANGGAIYNPRTPLATASGSALVFKQSANGPMTITAGGYVD